MFHFHFHFFFHFFKVFDELLTISKVMTSVLLLGGFFFLTTKKKKRKKLRQIIKLGFVLVMASHQLICSFYDKNFTS